MKDDIIGGGCSALYQYNIDMKECDKKEAWTELLYKTKNHNPHCVTKEAEPDTKPTILQTTDSVDPLKSNLH